MIHTDYVSEGVSTAYDGFIKTMASHTSHTAHLHTPSLRHGPSADLHGLEGSSAKLLLKIALGRFMWGRYKLILPERNETD